MADNTDYKLRNLSLFSGIGGIEIGLRRWCKTVCYCEINPYAVGVLLKNMAKGNLDPAPVWDDIRTFGKSEIETIAPVECITGGFPCQDISCAGTGAGITGSRSKLFFEIIRIIRLARPQIVFLENVPLLLARGMDDVLRKLAESGCDAVWKVLSAAELGAPHKRDRLWIMGYADERRLSRLGRRRSEAKFKNGCQNMADRNRQRQQIVQGSHVFAFPKGGEKFSYEDWWAIEPDVGRVADGLPFRVDRLKCLGNAVVPPCAAKAFEIFLKKVI